VRYSPWMAALTASSSTTATRLRTLPGQARRQLRTGRGRGGAGAWRSRRRPAARERLGPRELLLGLAQPLAVGAPRPRAEHLSGVAECRLPARRPAGRDSVGRVAC
jgi:hypothetical protein